MKDSRVEKVADILVSYSLPVNEGDLVSIRGDYAAEPLILALYQRCLERGANPIVRASIPQAEAYFYRFASDRQLEFVSDLDRWLIDNLDASFTIMADQNTRQLSRVDSARQAIAAATGPLLRTQCRRRVGLEPHSVPHGGARHGRGDEPP